MSSDMPFGCGPAAIRALGEPSARGVLRAVPEDFQVFELLSFVPTEQGAHWLLEVEKRGLTTRDAVAAVAKYFGVRRKDVGYAGLKDKSAVVRQWLSVPVVPDRLVGTDTQLADGLQVIAAHRHDRKLRQGGGAGNRFVVRLTGIDGDAEDIERRLQRCAREGVPNYFGPQRFGFDNVVQARDFLSGRRHCQDRYLRGLLISSARAELFNRLLARRVGEATWDRAIDGEVLNLAGSRSWFQCDQPADPGILQRLEEHDIHPTGPLWGKGEPPTRGVALTLEREAVAGDAELRDGLVRIGARQDRRSLRCPVTDLTWAWEGPATLCLRFGLGPGSYATALVRELVRLDAESST